ncbi:MAG: cobalamin-binding protein [Gammaproteobacteria bacterium]|nr:MAG: cobalamin-binding protein [Gammaproteobacteria bacterium]
MTLRLAAVCVAFLISGFNQQAIAASIYLDDFLGREVQLKSPATRIIALAPHIVENVFSAGAGDRLIAVVAHSDYPAKARKLPRVGSYVDWSFETIVGLQPDLVILWDSGNGTMRRKRLERLGFTVFVSELRRLQDIPKEIRAIGKMAGTASVSDAEANRIEAKLRQLRDRYGHRPPVRVFYQVWNSPLQTLSGEHMVSDVIRLCGGVNVFADEPMLAPKISKEAVIKADPDVILASGMGESRPEWLDEWRVYKNMKAVRLDALQFVPPDYIQRPTARILKGAQLVCEQLEEVRGRM